MSHHIGCWVAHTHWSVLGGTPGHAFYLAVAAANPNVQPGGWFLGIDLTFAELVAQLGVGAPFIGQLDAAGNAYTSLLVLGFACTGAVSFDSVVLEFDAAGSLVQASAPLTQSL